MSYLRMIFFVTKTDDGLYHVQNSVMAMLGQHHVHSARGYENWIHNVKSEDIKMTNGGSCSCGLKPGDVRSHEGAVWHNEAFE